MAFKKQDNRDQKSANCFNDFPIKASVIKRGNVDCKPNIQSPVIKKDMKKYMSKKRLAFCKQRQNHLPVMTVGNQ